MDGRTGAQIRATVLSILQGSATITGTVPSSRIYDSRLAPLPDDALPAILVYVHQEREDWAGFAQATTLRVETDVAVELAVKATTDALTEAALDFADTIKNVLLVANAFSSNWESLQNVNTARGVSDDGKRRYGFARLVFTVKHTRQWGLT